MADFAIWSTAAETGLGFEPGTFEKAYRSNRQAANDVAIEAMPIAQYVRELVEKAVEWTGTAKKLLAELNGMAAIEKKPKGWPETPRKLSADLKRLAPNLRATGIECDISEPGRGRIRTISLRTISKERVNTSPTSPSSPAPTGSTVHGSDVFACGEPGSSPSSATTSSTQVIDETREGDSGDIGDVSPPVLANGRTGSRIRGEL